MICISARTKIMNQGVVLEGQSEDSEKLKLHAYISLMPVG